MTGKAATACALAAAIATFVLGTGAAAGKTFRVTVTGDPEPGPCTRQHCSLREAVLAANATAARDEIVLPNRRRPYMLAREGTDEDEALTGDLDVLRPLRIVHEGKGLATIDADRLDRVLQIHADAPTLLRRLVIRDGSTEEDGGGIHTDSNLRAVRSKIVRNESQLEDGGGIDLDEGATLTMRRSVVARNVADKSGGAINTGGGAVSLITHSRVVDNRSISDDGGGIGMEGADGDAEELRIVRSLIVDNLSGASGGGIEAGGGLLVLERSTVVGNTAVANGGGIFALVSGRIVVNASTLASNDAAGNDGGGIYVDGPDGSIRNSTIAHNRANNFGGGIHAMGLTSLRLNVVTVARNLADADGDLAVGLAGGGLYRHAALEFEVRNSLIALNRSGQTPNDCAGDPITSLSHNLISTTSEGICQGFDQPGDLVAANPRLGPLTRNGGPTATIELRRGSPAIGKAGRRTAPKRDQRGRKRDKRPDIGAYERGA